jgi:hypothetical protein
MKPLELFEYIFNKKFYSIRIIQSYIYSKGDDILNPQHSTIIAEYKFSYNTKKESI